MLRFLGQVNTSVFRSEASGSLESEVDKEFGRAHFNLWLLLPLSVGFLIILAVLWIRICYRRYQRQNRELVVHSPVLDLPTSEPYESYEEKAWHTLSIDSSLKPFGIDETYRVQPRFETDDVLSRLLECPELADKRIPIQGLHFKTTLSYGASGEVWLAQFNGQQVAVKQLLPANEQVEDFIQEILLTASLNHQNIVSIIGVAWSEVKNVAMVMEHHPMGDLQRFLAESGRLLSWSRDKTRIAVGIARALRFIHGQNPPIVHRDLKSKNILLTDTLEAKLIDFGVSRSLRDGYMTAGIGTSYWIAPEILQGKRYTEKADIYSFGVVMSELDTCKTPFSEVLTADGKKSKPIQILNRVLHGRLTPTFSNACPRWIRSVGMQCLQHDPDLRPTAEELTQVLQMDARRRIYTL